MCKLLLFEPCVNAFCFCNLKYLHHVACDTYVDMSNMALVNSHQQRVTIIISAGVAELGEFLIILYLILIYLHVV